jgi:hypothetical protein
MQNINFAKTAIVPIVVVIAVATFQMMSMLSVQSAAAQAIPQGQCVKLLQELEGLTREQAREECKELALNQGECIKLAREEGFPEILCKFFF